MVLAQRTIAVLVCWALVGCSGPGDGLFKRLVRSKGQPVSSEVALAGGSGARIDSQGPYAEGVRLVGIVESADRAEYEVGKPIGEVAESIVARVNGDPILAREVFGPISARLSDAQQKLPSDQFSKFRDATIRQQLRNLIERRLLVLEARRVLPEPAVKKMEAMADQEFGQRIEEEMARMEVSTEAELRRKLVDTGQSLDQLQQYHRDTFIARQFLNIQIGPRLTVSRQDLIDYYNLHEDQFGKEGGVRWSEILISYDKYASRQAARSKAEQLLGQLRQGGDFAELAKAESDGATAFKGGKWDLTGNGSYIVAAVDEALFQLPVGKLSEPIEGSRGWHIVRVDESIEDGVTSFVDAQQEILSQLRQERFLEESKKYVQQLIEKAHITTVFDQPGSDPIFSSNST